MKGLACKELPPKGNGLPFGSVVELNIALVRSHAAFLYISAFPGVLLINRALSIISIRTRATGWVTSFAYAAKWAFRLGALLAVCAVRGHLCIGQTPVTFPGSTAVGATSSVLTVAVAITGNGTSVAPQAVTQGIAGEDFTAVGGSCSGGVAYTTGQSCTVDVTFGPKSPGLRSGAVVLKAVDGSLLGSTLLTGMAL